MQHDVGQRRAPLPLGWAGCVALLLWGAHAVHAQGPATVTPPAAAVPASAWPAPPALSAVPGATQSTDRNARRLELETYREALERFRAALEAHPRHTRADVETYHKLLDAYRAGMRTYRERILSLTAGQQ